MRSLEFSYHAVKDSKIVGPPSLLPASRYFPLCDLLRNNRGRQHSAAVVSLRGFWKVSTSSSIRLTQSGRWNLTILLLPILTVTQSIWTIIPHSLLDFVFCRPKFSSVCQEWADIFRIYWWKGSLDFIMIHGSCGLCSFYKEKNEVTY